VQGYVRDGSGNPATATVNWTTTGGTISATSTTTNGTATAVFSCTKAGTWTITGTVTNTVTATTTIIVTAGAATQISAVKPVIVGTVGETANITLALNLYDKNQNAVTTNIPTVYWSFSGQGTITLHPTTTTTSTNTLNWDTNTTTGKVVAKATITATVETNFTIIRTNAFITQGGTPTIGTEYGTITFIGTATQDCYIVIATSTTLPGSDKISNNRHIGVCVEITAYSKTGDKIGTPTNGYIYVEIPYTQLLINIVETKLKLYKSSDDGSSWTELSNSGVNTTKKIVYGTILDGRLSLFVPAGPCVGEPNLSGVFCYPNPCRVHKGYREITFTRLTGQATIRLFNVAGEEVAKIDHTDGTNKKEWTVPNKLSSGVYIYLIESTGVKKKIGKLGLIK
ncbi:T9SS type A sorting domain-containing protein, partial [bacterium]|nr:T9SS type A sorting domain-containing protein [bacterium]